MIQRHGTRIPSSTISFHAHAISIHRLVHSHLFSDPSPVHPDQGSSDLMSFPSKTHNDKNHLSPRDWHLVTWQSMTTNPIASNCLESFDLMPEFSGVAHILHPFIASCPSRPPSPSSGIQLLFINNDYRILRDIATVKRRQGGGLLRLPSPSISNIETRLHSAANVGGRFKPCVLL